MDSALEKVWTDESQRLLAARERFFDSLSAIKDLADFAVTQVKELDKKRSFYITVSRKDVEGLTEEESLSVSAALGEFIGSMASAIQEVPSEFTTPEEAPEEVRDKVYAQFDKSARKLEKVLPEGLDPAVLTELISTKSSRARTDLLLSSLLIAAVSDFEVLFSAIAAFFYRMRPESLRALDSKVSWREIEAYASLDDLRNHFIEERVDSLMRDGYDDWMKWLENQLKIKAGEAAIDPHTMYEALQRRHVLVHNGGRVSPQYLTKVNWLNNPPIIGVELRVDQNYLNSAIDELTVVGASLSHLVMRKLCPRAKYESVDSDAVALTYELLTDGRWKLVEKIADVAHPDMSHEYSRTAIKVNRWIAIRKSAGKAAIADEVRAWDVSALQKIFELARLTLLDDPSAIPLAHEMIESGDLEEEQIELWPLFDDIRSELRGDHPV